MLIWIAALFLSFSQGDERLPGGALTHTDFSKNAFSHPGPSIVGPPKQDFFVGNSFFKSVWVQAPSSTAGRDGLGPTYNAVACASCHTLDGRGSAYETVLGKTTTNVSLLFRLTQKGVGAHPSYGDQLNPFGVEGVPGEAMVDVVFEAVPGLYADGAAYELRRPAFLFHDFAFEAFDGDTLISPRVAPHMIGLGLVEAIAEAGILAHADPDDLDHDSISGKANYVFDVMTGGKSLGRFGWKANQPSLRQQDAGAFLGDMGLTNSLFGQQNCPLVQLACAQAVSGGTPEIDENILNKIVVYTQSLGVPARRDVDLPEVLQGQKNFNTIGCASCHTPAFTTGTTHEIQALREQNIFPYSDFLVHDMGEDLADHRPDGDADGNEWRTPPLWGLGLIETVNGHQNLLHDGRARGVEEAILWHGGEGAGSRDKFKKLSAVERKNLIQFVNSL